MIDPSRNPYDPDSLAWTTEKVLAPRRVIAVRWAVAGGVAAALLAGSTAWWSRPSSVALPAPAVTITISGTPVVVTVAPTPAASSAPPPPATHAPTAAPTRSTPPKPKPTKKPTKKATSTPKPSSKRPSINSLSCTRDGSRLHASASFSTGGSGGQLVWVMDGETMSRSIGASTSSASASMDLLDASASTCKLTISTGGGTVSASKSSN